MACESLWPQGLVFLVLCFSVSLGRGTCPSGAVLSGSRTWALRWLPPEQSRPPGGSPGVLHPTPSRCPAWVLVPQPCWWGIVSSFSFTLVSTAGFLCGFHVSFLEWLAGAHSGLLGVVPREGSGAFVHPWGAAGTTESRVPGGSAGRGPPPLSPEHCEASWRCCLPPLLPQPALASACGGLADCCPGEVLRPLSPVPCGYESYVGPFCVSHLKVSFLWTGVAATPAVFQPWPDAW